MGKHKYIESPERLWEYFQAYVKEVKANPFKVKDWVGKDGDEVKREKEKPLTMFRFLCYLDDNEIITDATDYFENKDNRYADYVRICLRIEREIKADQIEGGMAGMYNPSITQRLNGLTEKIQEDGHKELTIKVKYERKGNNTDGTPRGPAESYSGSEEV